MLVVWKIIHNRDFVWLMRRHLWALALTIYLFALTPVDAIVHTFGYSLRQPYEDITSKDIQSLLKSVAGTPEENALQRIVLRSMMRAVYSETSGLHFGLATRRYLHFTSPIRRYPDLLVHRLLEMHLGGQLKTRRDRRSAPSKETLAETGRRCSYSERRAEAAERELRQIKILRLLEGRMGDVEDGVVTGVARFGLFIQLVENLVEGLARVEVLGPEWFAFDAERFELRGSASGRSYRLGDSLRVRVDRVDRVLRRVDLVPEDAGAARRPRRGRQRT